MKLLLSVSLLLPSAWASTLRGSEERALKAYEYKWTEFVTDGPSQQAQSVSCDDAPIGSLVTKVGCKGSYCDEVNLYCRTGGPDVFSAGSSYWTEEVSEESEPIECKDDYFMTGLSCSGHYCDNVGLECTKSEGLLSGDCSWTGWMSEEDNAAQFWDAFRARMGCRGLSCHDEKEFDFGVRGIDCRGHFCDDKKFLMCQALGPLEAVPSPAPSQVPTPAPSMGQSSYASSILPSLVPSDLHQHLHDSMLIAFAAPNATREPTGEERERIMDLTVKFFNDVEYDGNNRDTAAWVYQFYPTDDPWTEYDTPDERFTISMYFYAELITPNVPVGPYNDIFKIDQEAYIAALLERFPPGTLFGSTNEVHIEEPFRHDAASYRYGPGFH